MGTCCYSWIEAADLPAMSPSRADGGATLPSLGGWQQDRRIPVAAAPV